MEERDHVFQAEGTICAKAGDGETMVHSRETQTWVQYGQRREEGRVGRDRAVESLAVWNSPQCSRKASH